MASIVSYVSGTPFTLRIRSSLTANRRVRWHNTFEFRAQTDGDLFMLEGFASAMVGFMSAICYSYVTIDEATVSSWAPDSHPYNPLGFQTTVFNQAGLKPMGLKVPVALRQTLFIKRLATTGLPGKLFVRGALSNEDLAYQDGEWALEDPVGMNNDVQAAVISTNVGEYLDGVGSEFFALALIGDSLATRYIHNLTAVGTSDVKLNHKYFDRS